MTGRGERFHERYDVTDEAFVYLYSRLPFLIQRVSQILTAMFTAESCGLNITLPQFQLLDLLARGGASPQIDLARKAEIDAATTGLILSNLIRSGRVERRVDPSDARRKIVAITRKGHVALAAAAESNRAVDRRTMERLGGDASLLGQLLERLAGSGPADATLSHYPRELVAGHAATLDLALKLRRCLQISEQQLAEAVGPMALTMRQFAVLYVMPIMPDATNSDVVRLLGYETSNAALVMHILRDKELIEPLNGARRRRYRITTAGLELLTASHSRVIAAERSLSKGLGDTDTTLLQRLLGSLVRHFDSEMRQPIPTLVAVQSQPGWPMPAAPAPAFLLGRRAGRSRKPGVISTRRRGTSTGV